MRDSEKLFYLKCYLEQVKAVAGAYIELIQCTDKEGIRLLNRIFKLLGSEATKLCEAKIREHAEKGQESDTPEPRPCLKCGNLFIPESEDFFLCPRCRRKNAKTPDEFSKITVAYENLDVPLNSEDLKILVGTSPKLNE